MTTTPTMRLEALAPEWLEAKIDSDNARKAVKTAEGRLSFLQESNDRHAAELKVKSRSKLPMLTNEQSLTRGSGSGFEIIHSACRCDSGICEHDPTQAPFDPEALEAARKTIERSASALAKAVKRLDSTDSSFDAFENARSVGARFVWWPSDRLVDPRTRRYRGMPVSAIDLEALGIHELNRALASGSIIEVT